jgi:hypothetical protein
VIPCFVSLGPLGFFHLINETVVPITSALQDRDEP